MIKKVIYDFEEFEEKIKQIIDISKKNRYPIIDQNNNWKTECELPIKHFTVGKGEKHIVFFGAFHGSEIISTEFLIYVLEQIATNSKDFESILEKYTLDFFPIVNPEGYVITTSAIRKLIPRSFDIYATEEICKQYLKAYKKDDDKEIELKKEGKKSDNTTIKLYQKMFEDVTYKDIPDKYKKIKQKLENLYNLYSIPKGAMIAWSANANGIDLNANTKYNIHIKEIEQEKDVYGRLRYSNIKISEPGPINCPYEKNKGFKQQKEIQYISEFLEDLYKKGQLLSILNYHSTGALLDQRASEVPKDMKYRNINLRHKAINNYLFSKFYQSETYKDSSKKTKYTILKEGSEVCTVNGLFRVLYPLDILIELSVIGGNPIGIYSNLKDNYESIMISNLKAVKKSLQNLDFSNRVADIIYDKMEEKYQELDSEEFIQNGYNMIDSVYEKIEEMIKRGVGKEEILKAINI